MRLSPDQLIFWQHGIFKLNGTIVFTWGLMLVLVVGSRLITRKLSVGLERSRWQNLLEIVVTAIEKQIEEVGLQHPEKYIGFLGTLFLFLALASENPKFFLGSDSAPHSQEKKECAVGACGVFSAPVLAQRLAMLFTSAGQQTTLRNFASRFGTNFYGLPPIKETFDLFEEETLVPDKLGEVVPFLAGTKLAYRYA